MEIQRCPECGGRLKTNYCDICLRKVPFKGMPAKQTFQHLEGSSAHRQEKGHECVSFDTPRKKTRHITFAPKQRKRAEKGVKKASALAIILAAVSVISSLFGLLEDQRTPVPEPAPETVTVSPFPGNVPAIEPMEIYNDGAIVVHADFTDLYYDDFTLFMTVINESKEDIVVCSDLLSVNGFMQSAAFYAEAEAGETVQEPLQLYTWELERTGIEEVAELAFHLNIYDERDYADIARSELITIQTEIAGTYEQPEYMDGWDLYLSDDVELRLVSYADNSGNCELLFYMENMSEDTVSISTPSIRINGEESDGYLWDTLRTGTRSIRAIYLYVDGIDDYSQLDEISMDLLIEHLDGWDVTETRTETITWNPNAL